MNKKMTWLGAALLAVMTTFAANAQAAVGNPSRLNIDVAVNAQLSVSVNGVNSSTYTSASWNTGTPNELLIAASSTTVINDSNVTEKWSLSSNANSINVLGNAEQWTMQTSSAPSLPGADQFALQAVFGSSNTVAGGCPAGGAANWDNGNIAPLITTGLQQYTTTRFADTALTNAGGLHTPDVGGSGNMLKTAKMTLITRAFFKFWATHSAPPAGTYEMRWKERAAAVASRTFVAGPAAATRTMSRRG